MATAEEVAARREENNRLRDQIEDLKRQQRDELTAADQDVRLARADREHASLEAELSTLMGHRVDATLTAPPAPETVAPDVAAASAPAPTTKPEPAAPAAAKP